MQHALPALTIVALLMLMPARALAAEFRQGDLVAVGPGEIINDDLYVFGRSVDIRGTVMGDVIAFGADVSVSGRIGGDLVAAAGTIRLDGGVDGSARVAGGTVSIDGSIGEDLLAGTGSLDLGSSAEAGRDVVVGAGSAALSGSVGRTVLASVGEMTLNGPVGGNVRAEVETLRLGEGARVEGRLTYRSAREAVIAPGAAVGGGIERQAPPAAQEPGPPERALAVLAAWLRALAGLFVLGLALVLLAPGLARGVVERLERSPGASLGVGFLALAVTPVLAMVLFVLGLFVGGWWLGLMLLALYAIALALGYVGAGLFVGRWMLARFGQVRLSPLWALLLGLAILLAIGLVPIAGVVVGLLAVLFGLGALVLALAAARRDARSSGPSAAG